MRCLAALAMPAGPSLVEAMLAAWERGDAVFPLDLRLPQPAQEALIDAVAPAYILDAGGSLNRRERARPVDEGDALVVATSGTTGEPRFAVLTYSAVEAAAHLTSSRIGVDPSTDRWLACLPLSHVGGLSVVTRAVLAGTALDVLNGIEPAQVEAAARNGANLVSLVATALARIDPELFRVILLGGGSPPDDVPPNAVVTYGMTETMGGVVYNGVALDGVDVKVDAEGTIRLRTPTLARCYRTASRDVPLDTRDGWFVTGDVGALSGTGAGTATLTVHGRRDEVIITGGEKVWPVRVERVLAKHPKVADVAIVGVHDPEWGQRVVAYVVAGNRSDPPNVNELREFVKGTSPPWYAPRELVLVDHIPKTALGKALRPGPAQTTIR